MANEKDALLCVNRDGKSVPIRGYCSGMPEGAAIPALRRAFACSLMLELCRGAAAHAYSGLIIVATLAMLEELRPIMTSNVNRCLIAEIESGVPLDIAPSVTVS
jgi:hypothetical protein